MRTTKAEYKKMVEKATAESKTLKDTLLAFITGGLICTLGQIICNMLKNYGFDEQTSRSICSIILVFLGSFLTAIKIYDRIAKHAGAGTIVPITGFANSIVSPAIEFKSEGHIMGIGAKMFVIAGPVLVFGTISSVVYGLIVYFFKLY